MQPVIVRVMWLTVEERVTLTVLGTGLLVGLGLLLWQQRRPPLTIEGTPNPAQTAQWETALASARQVDVNTASVAELERLPEVGPTLARRIVEYRTSHGPFRTPEELSHVQGIGPKKYEVLKDHITAK
jgi:competence protein ComEA